MKTNLVLAAEYAVEAFDHDSMRSWIRGVELMPEPDDSRFGKLLKAMRKAWYHDGTYRDRERVHVAAARLRFCLQWASEKGKA